ncbi:hypothetical protein ACS127_15150 [Amphibacillus sp. Q70]|uniref:hypothetical protein n=1 Tax=Amphibacillus sp. Q70 TaxID=3453416 RepID=UPI003F8329BA
MSSRLKFFSFIFCILLLITCYQDLYRDRDLNSKQTTAEVTPHSYYDESLSSFQVISYQVQQGEQLLTIIEKLNKQPVINIEQSVTDFISLNPSANIYQLEDGRVYLFPVYQ